jgi:hypothetical protein
VGEGASEMMGESLNEGGRERACDERGRERACDGARVVEHHSEVVAQMSAIESNDRGQEAATVRNKIRCQMSYVCTIAGPSVTILAVVTSLHVPTRE